MRRTRVSFLLLVGIGVTVEAASGFSAWRGLASLASCYWAWFPGAGVPQRTCTRSIPLVGFHLFVPVTVLGSVVVASIAMGLARGIGLAISARRVRAAIGPLVPQLSPFLKEATRASGAKHVELRRNDRPFAACVGILRPSIVVSTGLLGRLGHDELVAVLAHEERHRRRQAPLRQVVARSAVRALFLFPTLHQLLDAHLVDEEVLADQEASAVAGRTPLVTALARLSSASAVPSPWAAITGTAAMDQRLFALEHGNPERSSVRCAPLAVSLGCLCVLVLLIAWMPVAGLR